MFILYADKNRLAVRQREPVTSGSVNVYEVRFQFSGDWDGLSRTAVFRAGHEVRSVPLDGGNTCAIPWEVLAEPGYQLKAGVYGTQGGALVLPTVWESLGTILEGAAPGEYARPPTPELWEQQLAGKGDGLNYDGLHLSLMSGDKRLSTVEITSGGEGGGTSDHRALTNRDAEGQHPIGSIAGLSEELDRIPEPVEALTNSELEALLK